MTTREQERAYRTWHCLLDRLGAPEGWERNPDAKRYLGALHRTSARIYTSGLGQAIAFLYSRQKPTNMYRQAAQDLSTLALALLQTEGADLVDAIRKSEAPFMFAATDETLALCGWLCRYLTGQGVKQPMDDDAAHAAEEAEDPGEVG